MYICVYIYMYIYNKIKGIIRQKPVSVFSSI